MRAGLVALFAVVSAVRADDAVEGWWAFRPLVRPAPPDVPGSAFVIRNDIDRFVLAKLAEKGLTPPPEADRRTLVRRLYFDTCAFAVEPSMAPPHSGGCARRNQELLRSRSVWNVT